MVSGVPRLAFRRAHAVDHPVDRVLEPGAVEVRELTADREHPAVRLPPHPQPSRLASAPGLRPLMALRCVRTMRARSTGATCGARRAQSASLVSSANCATDPNCSALKVPACAAAATRGSDSRARAVSTVSRTVRSDTPSAAASDAVQRAPLIQYPRHRQLLHPQPALLTHQLGSPRHQPRRLPTPQLIEVLANVEHAPIQTRGCDSYPDLNPFDRNIMT